MIRIKTVIGSERVARLSMGRLTGEFVATQRIQRFARTVVHSNVLVAAAATGVGITTFAIAQLPVEFLPLGVVFVATWFAYTVNRFTDCVEDLHNLPGRRHFLDQYGRWMLWSGVLSYLFLLRLGMVIEREMLPIAPLPAIAIGVDSTGAGVKTFALKNGLVGTVWESTPLGLGI